MAPYLLFGFFAAGMLSVLISPKTVEEHLGSRGMWPVFKAALFGVPLPLCSCGVIPVAVSLRRHGASKGATTAFLLSTPQTGADSILVTFSLLGPVFAVFRPVAAMLTGLMGGGVVNIAESEAAAESDAVPQCTASCCTGGDERSRIVRALVYGFVRLPRDIAPALVVGLLIAGAIAAVVPEDYFADALGGGIVAMLVMMLVGIPMYVCSTASVPIAAALIGTAGVSPGAALAFLIAGPATNAATIATIWRILGKWTAIIYLLTIALSAIGCGLMLDWLFTQTAEPYVIEERMSHGGKLVGTISAIVLFIVLGAAMLPEHGRAGDERGPHEGGDRAELTITGMTCSHCAKSVRGALLECDGVEAAYVDLKPGSVVVHGANLDAEKLRAVVERLGYGVERETRPEEDP